VVNHNIGMMNVSVKHDAHTITVNKTALSADDKCVIMDGSIHTLSLWHHSRVAVCA
jgi:hypothetical protein